MSKSRNWFTFSIKDLLWLMLVVGLSVGWYVHSSRTDSELRDAHERQLSNWESVTQNERTARKRVEAQLRLAESELRDTRLEAARDAGGQAYARTLTKEINSLKLQLKKKQGEYDLLQAITARQQGAEVPVEALYDKAQLDKRIEQLKVEQSAAESHIEHLLKYQKKLDEEIRALVSDPSGRQVLAIERLTQENTSLKALLKTKQAEYEALKTATARKEEIEVPIEGSSKKPAQW